MNNYFGSLIYSVLFLFCLHIWCSQLFKYVFSFCKNHLVWKRIKGKWILITHATSVIGVKFCEHLANRKFKLIITGPNEQLLSKLKDKLSSKTEVVYYVSNYSSPNFTSFVNNYDIGLMINKIGFLDSEPCFFAEDNAEFILTQLHTGPLLLAKAVLKQMIERECGYIVNIGFTNTERPRPGYSLITAIKSSFRSWSECMYYELMGYNVNVEYMDTGLIDTEGCKPQKFFRPNPATFVKSVLKTFGNSYYTIPYLPHNFSNSLVFFFPNFLVARYRRNQIYKFSKDVSKLF